MLLASISSSWGANGLIEYSRMESSLCVVGRSSAIRRVAAKAVALLTAKELRHWRDGLLKRGLAAPSVKRTCRALKAALNLAATHDPRITNAAAWRIGLASLPDAESARNVILPEESVRAIINAAWDLDAELAISWQLHPSSSSTKAFARRVRRDAAEPSHPAHCCGRAPNQDYPAKGEFQCYSKIREGGFEFFLFRRG